MKIAILGGYGPSQSVGAVYRAFQRAGHEVWHWPTFPQFDKDLWHQHPLPDLLFTFKIGLNNVPRGFIGGLAIGRKIFWNFDDPHWLAQGLNIHWAREHDAVLTSCAESVDLYKAKSCFDAYFMPPAMDLEYYRSWKDALPTPDWHLCSFICTNLYPKRVFKDNFLDREEMIDRLTETFDKDFALYGFNREIEAKPRCRGALQWENTLPQAIRHTRMNIENHAYNKSHLYFNERFFQITSTRRAMFLDRCAGFTDLFGKDDEKFVWYSSLDELVEKLLFYKDKTEWLEAVGQNGFNALKGWTYDEFVKQVAGLLEGRAPRPTFLE